MAETMTENNLTSVCLDGSAVKRIRESQNLTQLYVSKVVGVTTDTVSRWENNRYPTIRRENALKLAEALDVPLEDLLRRPEQTSTLGEKAKLKLPYILLGLAVVLIIVFTAIFNLMPKPPVPSATVSAERILPKFAAPGAAIPVLVNLTYSADDDGFILREYFPKGWELIQSYPPTSSLDNVNGMARWIVKAGTKPDRIVYLLKVSANTKVNLQETFHGEVIIGSDRSQSSVETLGDTKTKVAKIHWADSDGDGQINDMEMLQASYTIEDMSGVHIDWNALERLWDAGSYHWDYKKGQFVPVRPLDLSGN